MQIKKLVFLTPKQGMTDDAFAAYWLGTHGPLIASLPNYGTWRQRYVQNHITGQSPVGNNFVYSGIAEFWIPGESPNEDSFSRTDAFREIVRPDELNFLDLDRTAVIAATEEVLVPGSGQVKLIILSHLHEGADNDLLRSDTRQRLSSLLVSQPLQQLIKGWAINTTIAGTSKWLGRNLEELHIDFVEEIWFDSLSDMNEILSFWSEGVDKPGKEEHNKFYSRSSFIAKEYTLYDER
ncbi:EthD domain-containing protein [Ochrobactrum sp. Q0168]|uniref:EthD domain-containing protein n=1 Tax=Ochrobactrum sp. Q0168 TaxID=2793241 RepID=UPI0018EB365C|nr:EthD domain-containing protein [Ochrobactrum sp. Q0168]